MREPRVSARGSFFLGRMSIPKVRVAVFVDGFNLYHAICELGENHLKWVCLWQLGLAILPRNTHELVEVTYFTAYATWMPDSFSRHREYVKGLGVSGVKVVFGNFKKRNVQCRSCKSMRVAHEEKQTDINLALGIVSGAINDSYDHAFVISNDSDLVPAFNLIRENFPHKKITTVGTPSRWHSNELIQAANGKAQIKKSQLEKCLLPQTVVDAAGKIVATRPIEYDPTYAFAP